MNSAAFVAVLEYENPSARATVASLAFLTYDYVLSFPNEVQYVWHTKWTPGKVLYLLARYLPFVYYPMLVYFWATPLATDSICTFSLVYWEWMAQIQVLLFQLVIGLRTWVLWERRRSLAVVLVLAWLCLVVVTTVYLARAAQDNPGTYVKWPAGLEIPGCTSDSSSQAGFTATVYVARGTYEVLLFVLTLLRGIVHWRYNSAARLCTVMYRDAFVVSISSAALISSAIALLYMEETQWAYALNFPFSAACSVFPSRIILNIREAALSLDDWDIPTQMSFRDDKGQAVEHQAVSDPPTVQMS